MDTMLLWGALAITLAALAIYWRIRLGRLQTRLRPLIALERRQAERAAAELQSKEASEADLARRRKAVEDQSRTLVADAEARRQSLSADIASLQQDKSCLVGDKAALDQDFTAQKAAWTTRLTAAQARYDQLQLAINALEESLDMTDYGMYRPHFDFRTTEEYQKALAALRDGETAMIKQGQAVVSHAEWAVSGSKAEGRKMTRQTQKLMLRAFNGECDAALAKVRWDNVDKMEARVRKAAETINKLTAITQSEIDAAYLQLKIDELYLTHELREKLWQDREEQRAIQEEMREEERARRERAKAQEDAAGEEARYEKALAQARDELAQASGEQTTGLRARVTHLEAELARAQELKQRASSQAQLTRAGYVYIISNIGSFGEGLYKIGMTRRLEPEDRVRELSGASVPFEFDIHAMVYSEDAPDLEHQLHLAFADQRVNLINPRKEFFRVSLDAIEAWANARSLKLQLTKVAEAHAFHESQALRKQAVPEAVKISLLHQYEGSDRLFDEEEELEPSSPHNRPG